MSQVDDAGVIQSALGAHLAYLHTLEAAHRSAARALSTHPDLAPTSHARAQRNPITMSAAHRARCASFGQRGEFVEQLAAFPAAGLSSLTAQDMRTLQVPAHIGSAALPEEIAGRIATRETDARLAAARPAARPAAGQQPGSSSPKPRTSFDDILHGHRGPDHGDH